MKPNVMTVWMLALLFCVGVSEFGWAQDAGLPVVRNGSFENPQTVKPVGIFKEWEFSSAAGTGTWPAEQARASGMAYGRNVGVIHAGGYIGQVLKDAEGMPLRIVPGTRYRLQFENLPYEDSPNVNMGIYVKAGNKDAAAIATPVPFLKEQNKPGLYKVDFEIYPADRLPVGWQGESVYLLMLGLVDRVVLDNVQVGLVEGSGKEARFAEVKPGEALEVGSGGSGAAGETAAALPSEMPGGELVLANASFEEPSVPAPTGAIKDWDSNSLAGTGTWPVVDANAEGEADGKQVGVVHAGGIVGQVVRSGGQPVPIVPGTKFRISFLNLPHREMGNINLGIYLLAGNGAGGRVADAQSLFKKDNTAGEKQFDLTIFPAAQLDISAPGWRGEPLYLKFQNFSERAVLDAVRIEVLP